MSRADNSSVENITLSENKCIDEAYTSHTSLIMSHEVISYVTLILIYGVTPVISIFGMTGNIFSIIIIKKHGLRKCSNILLICLAFADLGYLIATNSVPKILYEVVGLENAWEYTKDASFALFIFYQIFRNLDNGMYAISLTIPLLITIERLVAVFLPLKFHLIITPARTWCTVGFFYAFWYTLVIYMSFWFTFNYTFDTNHNISVGIIGSSALYIKDLHAVHAFELIGDYMLLKIPPLFTLIGCIVISVKVRIASSQRKKITTANAKVTSSNRTTKMLLAVCVVYVITCGVRSLNTYLPQLFSFALLQDTQSDLVSVIYQVLDICVCINSSVNFVVYVGMNKNFRDTYKSLFIPCGLNRKKSVQVLPC